MQMMVAAAVMVSGSKHPTESLTLHTQLPVGDVYNHKQPDQFTHTHDQYAQSMFTHSKQKKEK